MNDDISSQSPVLAGWKEIAKYLNMGVRTVQRYECEHRSDSTTCSGGAVIATKAELDEWLATRPKRRLTRRTLTPSPDSTRVALQAGMLRMGQLTNAIRQRRSELRTAVDSLHSSIHVVR